MITSSADGTAKVWRNPVQVLGTMSRYNHSILSSALFSLILWCFLKQDVRLIYQLDDTIAGPRGLRSYDYNSIGNSVPSFAGS